jgi:hypothetical protein
MSTRDTGPRFVLAEESEPSGGQHLPGGSGGVASGAATNTPSLAGARRPAASRRGAGQPANRRLRPLAGTVGLRLLAAIVVIAATSLTVGCTFALARAAHTTNSAPGVVGQGCADRFGVTQSTVTDHAEDRDRAVIQADVKRAAHGSPAGRRRCERSAPPSPRRCPARRPRDVSERRTSPRKPGQEDRHEVFAHGGQAFEVRENARVQHRQHPRDLPERAGLGDLAARRPRSASRRRS